MKMDGIIPSIGLYGDQEQFPDFVHCEAFSRQAPLHDWRIAIHRHPQMSQLFVIDSGRVKATTDDTTWEFSSGSFLFVPEDCAHGFEFEPGTKGWVFSFPSSVSASIAPQAAELTALLAVPFTGPFSQPLRQIIEVLIEVESAKSAFRGQTAIALSQSILSLLADRQKQKGSPVPRAKSDRIFLLDRLISERAAEGWSASRYAEALSITTGHLSRLCRRASGLGSAAYIERKVMAEACRLLAFTTLPVSEIGYRLGYNDPSYFSKRFNNAQGQSPTVYRARFIS